MAVPWWRFWKNEPNKTEPTWTINLLPAAQTSVPVTAAWTMYAGTKVLVRTGEYFDLYPETRDRTSAFDEECYARDAMAEQWAARQDATADDSYLDLLVRIRSDGFIREYVWRFVRDTSWQEPVGLNLEAFDTWALKNGLFQHEAPTLAYVSPEQTTR